MIQKPREFLVTQIPSEPNCSVEKHFCTTDLGFNVQNDLQCEFTQTIPDSFLFSYQIPSIKEDSLFTQPKDSSAFQKYHLLDGEKNNNSRKLKTCSAKKRISNTQLSLSKIFQRIRTQMSADKQLQKEEQQKIKRAPQRRMCKLKTKQEFFQQCQDYITKKEKQGVDELFREVNRAMKTSQQKEEGNLFYQNIRREALKKIQYMYCNQKYYDDQQVRHLHSVVQSCNVLIHKKICKIDAKPLYNIPQNNRNHLWKKNNRFEIQNKMKKFVEESRRKLQKNINAKSSNNLMVQGNENLKKKSQLESSLYMKKNGKGTCSSRSIRLQDEKNQLSGKIGDIVNACGKEKEQLRGVKTGMKIFEYYCQRVSSGMQSRQVKLGKHLKWEQV